ncbi:MAG: response regulator [Desulfovibrionaceae bacterium]
MRFLIVEDEVISRTILKGTHSPHGECVVAVDGNAALAAADAALIRGRPFDIITMDIRMPNLAGVESLKKIREMERRRQVAARDAAKVVMATSVADMKTVFPAHHDGSCQAHVLKPHDAHVLLEKLREVGLPA